MLFTELSSALRGYPLEYETYPLSFNEYCRFKGIATNSFLEQDKARLRNAFEMYNQESAFKGILEASTATGCDNLLIVTKDEEKIITREGKQINVVSAWKWLLQND